MTVTDIIEKCGGEDAVANAIEGVTFYAVRKWRLNGIPEKHWASVICLAKSVTPKQLHALNQSLRTGQAA